MRLIRAVNRTAYLKAGILGFPGSGKTHTAALLALGLAKDIGDKRPVAFFDTETGSDFHVERFRQAGVDLLIPDPKTRAFKDLLSFMREAEQNCSVAIIDSITHVWQELLSAYQERLKRKNGLQFQDWAKIKEEWRQFTDLFVNSRLHVIMCGRAAFEYDYTDREGGGKDLVKTGTKMKAESELGYEPSLLLEMVRLPKSEATGKPKAKGWINRCVVLKDRTDSMNGKEIDYPKYETFRSVISFLNVGGEHVGIDPTRNSEDMFDSPEHSRNERARRVDICKDKIKAAFVQAGFDSKSSEAGRQRIQHLLKAFGTNSWVEVEHMRLEDMETGLERLEKDLGHDKKVDVGFESATNDDVEPEPPSYLEADSPPVAKAHVRRIRRSA